MGALRTPGIRPRETLRRRLDALSRRSFPAGCTAALLLLAAAPLDLPGQAQLQVAVALGCVFFWSLAWPAGMTPLAVFLLGLLADLLGLTPPGVLVLVLLAAHALTAGCRRVLAQQGFLAVWLAFAVVAAGAAVMEWAMVGLLSVRLMPAGAALLQFGLTAGVYPALAALLTRAHRGLADPDQA